MEIIRTSENLGKITTYALTKQAKSFKEIPDGELLEINGQYIEYVDENSKGEAHKLFAFMTADGTAYSGQSETFKREFLDIVELDLNKTVIRKISGVTNAGREYVSCELDITNSIE